MHLSEFLASRGAKSEFVKATGFSPGYVSDVCAGKTWPSLAAWRKIVEVTDGRVTPDSHLHPAPTKEASANGESEASGEPAAE